MYNITGAAADVLRRVVYPSFSAAWGFVRDVTGRQRRRQRVADDDLRTTDKRRHLDAWNKARDER